MPHQNYVHSALDRLRKLGFRITRGRRLVLEALEKATRPLSPYALHDQLAAVGEAVDTVSIYRTLETLESSGLAHRIASVGGFLPCRLDHHHGCHHHLICRACGRVEEVDCPGVEEIEGTVSAASGYRIERHLVEFVGLCPACQ